ncbi:MAG: hypothetical protein G01um101438_717 [Parcubacteria group bacterium Gr01-1014_38]|nr:MAG: hypothetical protein G01um101438_717 [Parcubacteria group bacterium Gr01-1014_38]
MVSPHIAELVREIFACYGEEIECEAKKDPEAYLVYLLTAIKEELPHVWATLQSTVEEATLRYHEEATKGQRQRAK